MLPSTNQHPVFLQVGCRYCRVAQPTVSEGIDLSNTMCLKKWLPRFCWLTFLRHIPPFPFVFICFMMLEQSPSALLCILGAFVVCFFMVKWLCTFFINVFIVRVFSNLWVCLLDSFTQIFCVCIYINSLAAISIKFGDIRYFYIPLFWLTFHTSLRSSISCLLQVMDPDLYNGRNVKRSVLSALQLIVVLLK